MKMAIKIWNHNLVVIALLMPFMSITGSVKNTILICALSILLVSVMCVTREKAQSLLMFICVHIGLLVLEIGMIYLLELPKWYLVILIFEVLYSMVLKFVPKAAFLEKPGYAYLSVLVLLYVIVNLGKNVEVTGTISLWLAIIGFLTILLYENLESMEEFIRLRQVSDNVDESKLKRTNVKISLLYIGGLGAVLGVFSLWNSDSLWAKIGSITKDIMGFFFRLLPVAQKEHDPGKAGVDYRETLDLTKPMIEGYEAPRWTEWLNSAIRIVAIIVFIAIVIAVVAYVVTYIYHHFNHKVEMNEEQKLIEKIERSERIKKTKGPSFFERFDRTPTNRVRRLYKKHLKKALQKQTKELMYMVPEEQVNTLREHVNDEQMLQKMRGIYEKARYSDASITDEEFTAFQKCTNVL